MKKIIRILYHAIILSFAFEATAAIRYVNLSNTTPVSPFTSWATAAITIQSAVDAAQAGDEIVVTNGVYQTGGKAISSLMTNRVAINKAVKLRSVNGPEVTVIQGYQVPGVTNGDGAIRCVYMVGGASLVGFTLANGATRSTGDTNGGGVWAQIAYATTVSNCVLTGNSAFSCGGGAYSVSLTNCTLMSNSASFGGGAYSANLKNCILADNLAAKQGGGAYSSMLDGCTLRTNMAISGGGGAFNSTLRNCVVKGNSGGYGGGAYGGVLKNCLLTGNRATMSYGGGTYDSKLTNCTVTGNSAQSAAGGCYMGIQANCIIYYNCAPTASNYSDCFVTYSCAMPRLVNIAGNIDAGPQMASASHLSATSPCRGAGLAAYASGTDIDGQAWKSPPSIGCDEFYAGTATNALSVSIQTDYTNVAVGFSISLTAQIEGVATASRWEFGDGTVTSNQPYASYAWSAPGNYPVVLRVYNDANPDGVSATGSVHVLAAPAHYVSLDSGSPSAPYNSWTTAATTIQSAIDAVTVPGSLVLVSNGVYEAGGRVVNGVLTNRVVIDKPVRVESLNGPKATVIKGYQVPQTTNGDNAIRCAYLTNGAMLTGFTLTNGATRTTGTNDQYGGAVWCAAPSSVVSNCVIVGNSAFSGGGGACSGTLMNCLVMRNSTASSGGGAFSSTMNNCALTANSANIGGGAYQSTLNNCTLAGNSAGASGGGTCNSTLRNSIVYYNVATNAPNYSGGTLYYCCTTPVPGIGIGTGIGNITDEPDLASASHLCISSPCCSAGSAVFARGTDIDGEAWGNPPSIGCDEVNAGATSGEIRVSIQVNYSTVMAGFEVDFAGAIEGQVSASRWEFGDGTVISNRPYASHTWAELGDYAIVLRAYNDSNPGGISATTIVHVIEQPVHYVTPNSISPIAPYSSWATAATNIQDAIDAVTVPGALVLVTNGIFGSGGRAVYGTMTNRVAMTKMLTLRSVSGPTVTTIKGYQVPGWTNGDGAVRCAYLTSGSTLSGFTLTDGATRTAGDTSQEKSGGGVWCLSASAIVSNCVISGNSARSIGGGACNGTLKDCILAGNISSDKGGGACSAFLTNCNLTANSAKYGGGAYDCILSHCAVAANFAGSGGGTYLGSLNQCTVTGNRSATYGGGAFNSSLNNSVLSGNSAASDGGGAYSNKLNNCVLTGNSAFSGGGACGSTLNGCVLAKNSAQCGGGGAYHGSLLNSVLTGNSAAVLGGGTYEAVLTNCTLTGNRANRGGGVSFGTAYNCIVYYNDASIPNPNCDSYAVCNFTCTTPLPGRGAGNIEAEPQLASASHLSAASPCRGVGSATCATGTDIDGEAWASPPSIGCDEFHADTATNALSVNIQVNHTNVAAGFSVDLIAEIEGCVTASRWEFEDGTLVNNRPYTSHAWEVPGDHAIVLRAYNDANPGGVCATTMVHVVAMPVHYVALNSPSPLAPYSSWATAATSIQDAVDAATIPGALVLVSDGVYRTGGRVVREVLTNRVAVTKPLILRSLNGPAVTVIEGCQMSGTTNGDSAVRCVYLTNGATLAGFALTNGATRTSGDREQSGGGVWCDSLSAVVSNCVLTGNSAYSGGAASGGTLSSSTLTGNSAIQSGGGAAGSILDNCWLMGNKASYGGGAFVCELNRCMLVSNTSASQGGGADQSFLHGCTLTGNISNDGGGAHGCDVYNCTVTNNLGNWSGGGAGGCMLINCTLAGNQTPGPGGGAEGSRLENCILTRNSAFYGGGAYASTLYNCTVVSNSASGDPDSGGGGGGVSSCFMHNCVCYYNTALVGPNYFGDLDYCCTTPLPTTGAGNITNTPAFVDMAAGNFHLQSNSPCINSGNNVNAPNSTDMDGQSRIVAGTVDIGAYEFQTPSSSMSYAWAQQYVLVTDGPGDFEDPDGDGLNNWQEWRAGTDPTNGHSVLKMLSATPLANNPTVFKVSWQSVSGMTYYLQRSESISTQPVFMTLQSNLVGQPNITTYTDTNATTDGRFYRVGVQ